MAGISLFMQPVQDLTIEDRVSRTQYQFTVEDPDPNNLSKWVPKLVERYLAGDIDVDSFVSHRISLDDVNRGFELMEAQDGIRSVIELT